MKVKRIFSLLLAISIIVSIIPSLSVNATAGQMFENTVATTVATKEEITGAKSYGKAVINLETEDINPPNGTGIDSTSFDSASFAFANPKPMIPLGNSGPSMVEYTRKSPEVAILNMYNGNSAEFYNTLTSRSSSYNGIRLFGKTVDSQLYADDIYYAHAYMGHIYDDPLIYPGFKDENNILYQLNHVVDNFNRSVDNLEVSVSGNFHNNWHYHSLGFLIYEDSQGITQVRLPEEIQMMSYSGMSLEMNNRTIIQQYGSKKDNEKYPRIGNGEFASMRSFYNQDDLILWITRSVQNYDNFKECCICGDHYIEKAVVAFRDQRAPQISEVYLNGENAYNIGLRPSFDKGDTIDIKIKYSEPIRFADDSAEGKENLYVKLLINGVIEGKDENIHPRATLTKLENDTLYFSYTVPEDSNVHYEISQIDLSPLMGRDIELKQVGPVAEYMTMTHPFTGESISIISGWTDGSFTVEVPSDARGNALGYTESTSYITDLAGNPINNEIIQSTFYIDTKDIEIKEIVPSFFSSNINIKEMLGKTDPSDVGYPDNSDTHMGGRSIFRIAVAFNKVLAIGEPAGGTYRYSEYKDLVATTNMKDKDGNFITLLSNVAYPVCTKFTSTGSCSEYITHIVFSLSPSISTGMTCDDPDGILRIRSIDYVDNTKPKIKDIRGKEFEGLADVDQRLVSRTFYLDRDKAIVRTNLNPNENTNVYTPQPVTVDGETRAFRFPFIVEDFEGVNASGVIGLTGSFSWAKSESYLSENWPFQYLITSAAQLDGREIWLDGYVGRNFYDFTQIDGVTQYLYIRPVEGQEYSLFDTELRFRPLDYAKNEYLGNDYIVFPIDTIWEDQPPTAAPRDVRRSLDTSSGEGTLEVDVFLQDQLALKEAYYLWNDGEEPPEFSHDPLWTPAEITFIANDQLKTGEMTARATVEEKSKFSKHLWVKVFDQSDNELTANMGLYEYNLTELAYELKYSSSITAAASLQVEAIESDGLLVFMVAAPGTTDEYFVRLFGDNVADLEKDLDRDAFRNYALSFISGSTHIVDTFWERMKVTEENGRYTFEYIENADKTYIDSITRGTMTKPYFNGNLEVTVLSGHNAAFILKNFDAEKYHYPLEAGTEGYSVAKETVALRMSHNKEDVETDTFPNITFEPDQIINIKPNKNSGAPDFYTWDLGAPLLLSTAEGVEFRVDLGVDKYGWNYEDVDFANSYIELQLTNTFTTFQAYLKGGRNQTVVFPKDDYPGGNYKVTLHVKCYAGKDYEIDLLDSQGNPIVMHIDASETASDFGLSSLTYTPDDGRYIETYYSHGLDTQSFFHWETKPYTRDQVIYLPTHMAYRSHELTVEIKDYKEMSEFAVKVWNVTTKSQAVETSYYIDDEESQNRYLSFSVYDTAGEALNSSDLGLVRNQDNMIAIQVANRNGLNSQIKYYTIHPVDEEVKGTTSVTRGIQGSNVVATGNVIFTPDPGQLMDGVRVFATAIPKPISSDTWQGTPREMSPQYDGTYTCPLTEGNNYYYVYSIDKYGNLNLYDLDGNIMYSPSALLDKTAPVVTTLDSSADEGIYEAVFKIEDDTINALAYDEFRYTTVYMPLTISLSFDENYTEKLKLENDTKLEFTLNQNPDEYVWTTQGRSPSGIYEVRAERKSDVPNATSSDPHYLEVTVKGAISYQEDDSDQTFILYMDARDALGNSTATQDAGGSINFVDVKSVPPRAYTEADGEDKAPAYDFVRTPSAAEPFPDKALIIQFNMPVLPEASWINPDPQYGRVQIGAFPITKDGIYDIKYYDVFGNPITETLTLNDVFGFWGPAISVDIYPEDLTAGDVTVLVSLEESYTSGGLLLFIEDGDELIPVSDDESTKYEMKDEKQITLTDNTKLIAYRYTSYNPYEDLVEWDMLTSGFKTEINISNIVKTPPVAKGYLYFSETGTEYALEDVPRGETSGKVIARYTASRKVLPTEGTGTEHTFKYGGNGIHTFSFADDLGQTGSLTIDLEQLGVTIADPSVQTMVAIDIEKPRLTLNMYAKRFDRYNTANTFNGSAEENEIKGVFDAAGYVQGYLFDINVLEQSDYKIVLMKNQPQDDISYQTAVSDSILGVSQQGRSITVTDEITEDLYVVVVDNAKAETNAEKDNYAYTFLKAEDMMAWIDTTAPRAISEIFPNSLYEKTAYITFSDKANADSDKEIGNVTLSSPNLKKVVGATGEEEKYNGWYKLVFHDNTSQELVFYDMAGNRAIAEISVTGIDTNKPEVRVVWSPPYVISEGQIDVYSPTLGPVNTDIKAIITADKPMVNVFPTAYTTDGTNWEAWPYFPPLPIGISFSPDMIYTGDSTCQLVTVTFNGESGGVLGVRIEVMAPNWQTSEVELQISEGVIDKTPPVISQEVNYQKREGFDAPYAAQIILTPNEPSYCMNGGKAGVLYDVNNPLTISTFNNGKITYRFTDKAGNIGSVDVTTTSIDRTSPKITTDPENTKKLPFSGSVTVKIKVDEKCTIECDTKEPFTLDANTEKTLTFTENGVYQIKAYDAAGNLAIATVVIGSIDKTAPMISFDNMTIRVRQDSELTKLEEMLGSGVNMWDNLDSTENLVFTYNLEGVNGMGRLDLSVPGLYAVPYTVTDTAGNEGYATRYVRVFDKNMPGIIIDDIITEPEGTTVLFKGKHQLKIEGLKLIAPGEMEPYTIKICNGIRSEGQMKYYLSTVPIDELGNFTLNGTGFYTLYITTQSRQSYRTLLYVER